jgi:hypothetical protein
MRSVADQYQQLICEADQLAARLSARYFAHLTCRAGCSSCGQHHLSVFEVEAEAVRQAAATRPDETRARLTEQAREARGGPVTCSLLVDGRSAILAIANLTLPRRWSD